MKDWKSVPMPHFVTLLPKDSRGFPIPYTVLRGKNGEVFFKANDSIRVLDCIRNGKCTICGQNLHDNAWLVGGPMSAFHPNGAYADPPNHYDCLEYAMQVCPYLLNKAYDTSASVEDLKAKTGLDSLTNPTIGNTRTPFFVAVMIDSYKVSDTSTIIPNRPFLKFEFWEGGKRITKEEAAELIKNWKKESVVTVKVTKDSDSV